MGLASVVAAQVLDHGRGLKAIDWEVGILIGISILMPWFATGLYGSIKPAFGGGTPASARFYLKEESPVFGGKIFDGTILEETDQGYYVMRNADTSRTAVFVPRSSVSTAQFNSQK